MPDLTIEQHEKEINAIQDQVKVLYAAQQEHHDAAERKRKLIPIVATDRDQTLTPSSGVDLLAWAKSLPQAAIDAINSLKGKD